MLTCCIFRAICSFVGIHCRDYYCVGNKNEYKSDEASEGCFELTGLWHTSKVMKFAFAPTNDSFGCFHRPLVDFL